MQDIQKIFDEIQKLKKEQREFKKEYKYDLDRNESYQEITGELKKMREKKKNIEEGSRPPRIDEIKYEISKLNEMISDIAINSLMDGKSIYLKDEYDAEYEPVYKVTFKKIK
ncbi:MAG: hypothetical protein PHH24_03280 [Candidatus Moranbacteria bacterium]|jgi:Tfp pilus assembly protein PilO|nr:hypothetical protein [Candidatus Moranbacteria bacterium]MDD5652059.1 hypothetical protein [Candidatus Moranbacteria bacterium]MDX9855945.1 hypothetical protein [Candidatus Moranbacteria bacterium]